MCYLKGKCGCQYFNQNKSPEENCLNKSVDDSNDLAINTVQICFGQNDIGPNNENNSKCIPCLICDSCQLVQEVQHERSIKRSSDTLVSDN
jgi:hypothetical protein